MRFMKIVFVEEAAMVDFERQGEERVSSCAWAPTWTSDCLWLG